VLSGDTLVVIGTPSKPGGAPARAAAVAVSPRRAPPEQTPEQSDEVRVFLARCAFVDRVACMTTAGV